MEQIDVARMALQRVLVGKAGGIVFRGEACDVVGGRDGLSHGGGGEVRGRRVAASLPI